VRCHGLAGLFAASEHAGWFFVGPPVAVQILHRLVVGPREEFGMQRFSKTLEHSEAVGRMLLATQLPCTGMKLPTTDWATPRYLLDPRHRGARHGARSGTTESGAEVDLGPDALFGAFALLAPYVEMSVHAKRIPASAAIPHPDLPVLGRLGPVLLARLKRSTVPAIEGAMQNCGFASEHQEFIRNWVEGRISLTLREKPSRERGKRFERRR